MDPTDAAPGFSEDRAWVRNALALLEQEATRSADTHLLRLDFPGFPDIAFYFKDEATHPTGSLKHRLARSLFLYALCNGRLHPGQTVVDASSGSTAISEAWFARLLGLPFIAVMPACTAPQKILDVQALGGHCDLVDDPTQVHARAAAHSANGACHLDQFGLAERATDWRGNNNIAESIVGQLRREPQPEPTWIVCGVGTGGTSATIGRYLRYRRLDTRLCVAEPVGSSYVHGWRTRDRNAVASQPTLIEGIGRPMVEPGFLFDVVDEVVEVADAGSIAAALQLEELLGVRYGGSSGTNFVACLQLATAMRARGERGSIVSLLCDRGTRYQQTLFDPAWRAARGVDIAPWRQALADSVATGTWNRPTDTPAVLPCATQTDEPAVCQETGSQTPDARGTTS
ncbi:PLP-dependent cysteine synthase family protein [Aerolutibacter ruishenii]|uniref:cysteine synthase n=1 Tax=Aerolutibacter ruishenii TaxID=686800 RepID=A0A562LXY8_9GAMM|nr:PLP-dependent cysteine synthase family protein [Lysobacter ruishenii]TWI12511.1 cysteine synthase A [Lysobacter ruishenii]